MYTVKLFKLRFLILLACLFTFSLPSQPRSENKVLGRIDFPTSGAAEAQPHFIRGMLLMHSFEYEPAAAAFRQAQDIDPDFAMAYWGEAMTNHHSLWRVQHKDAGQKVLLRLGKTTDERASKAPTQREKDYLRAAEVLFGMTNESKNLSKLQRDVLYRNAMEQLYLKYPTDMEARALYGLSILGVGSVNRNYTTYMEAAAIVMPVWNANSEHPGAAHYLIHAFDDPVHAILALPMARAYGKIAVDAAHAQHMTSHIYIALGLWEDMTAANVTALAVESAKTVGEGSRSREAWHHRYWLHYGLLQQRKLETARAMLTDAKELISNDPLSREPAYYGAMFARYLIDTELWAEVDEWLAPNEIKIPTPHYYFTRCYALAKLGQLDEARQLLDQIESGNIDANPEIVLDGEEIKILKLEALAIIAAEAGNKEQALEHARLAAQMQLAMPFRYGPPRIPKPSSELLGDIYFQFGDFEEAIRMYQDELTRSKGRVNSLLGLARSSMQRGDKLTAREAYENLAMIWESADPHAPDVAEVHEFFQTHNFRNLSP